MASEKELQKRAEQTILGLLTLSNDRLRKTMERMVLEDNPSSADTVRATLKHLEHFLWMNTLRG